MAVIGKPNAGKSSLVNRSWGGGSSSPTWPALPETPSTPT
ncbi:MAG: GTPase [Dysosmobacter sp.]